MRKRKIVASILTLAMVITLSNSVPVNAAAVSSSEVESTTELDNEIQSVTEELEPEDISILEANIMDREYAGGQFSVSEDTVAILSGNEVSGDVLYSTKSNDDALYSTEANDANISSDEV